MDAFDARSYADLWYDTLRALLKEALPSKGEYDKKELNGIFTGLVAEAVSRDEKISLLDGLISSGLLSYTEILALLLIASAERDPQVLSDIVKLDGISTVPTASAVMALAGAVLYEDESDIRQLMDPDNYLNRFLLRDIPYDFCLTAVMQPLVLTDYARSIAWGMESGLGILRGCGSYLYSYDAEGAVVAAHDEHKELVGIYAAMVSLGEGSVVVLQGEKGCGRTFLAKALAWEAGVDVLALSGSALSRIKDVSAQIVAKEIAVRMMAEDCILYIGDITSELSPMLSDIILSLQDMLEFFILGCGKEIPDDLIVTKTLHIIPIPSPGAKIRRALWEQMSAEMSIRFSDTDTKQLAADYELLPGQIRNVLASARLSGEISSDAFTVTGALIERQIERFGLSDRIKDKDEPEQPEESSSTADLEEQLLSRLEEVLNPDSASPLAAAPQTMEGVVMNAPVELDYLVQLGAEILEEDGIPSDPRVIANREVIPANLERLVRYTGGKRIAGEVNLIIKAFRTYNSTPISDFVDEEASYDDVCAAVHNIMEECINSCDIYLKNRRGWSEKIRSRGGTAAAARKQMNTVIAFFDRRASIRDEEMMDIIKEAATGSVTCARLVQKLLL